MSANKSREAREDEELMREIAGIDPSQPMPPRIDTDDVPGHRDGQIVMPDQKPAEDPKATE